MPDQPTTNTVKVEYEFSRDQLTAENIKKIADFIVAELATLATGTRGGIEHSKECHSKGHGKW